MIHLYQKPRPSSVYKLEIYSINTYSTRVHVHHYMALLQLHCVADPGSLNIHSKYIHVFGLTMLHQVRTSQLNWENSKYSNVLP